MNAVTFMDAMKQPSAAASPPPRRRRRGLSANTALIAGVGTLLLALGVGVMIGRSGSRSVATAPAAPQIVKLGESGHAEKTASGGGGAVIGGGASKAKAKKQKPATLKKEAESQAGAEEVLKPAPGVKLPPPTVQPGGKCPPGSAGCKHGKFTGEFFE